MIQTSINLTIPVYNEQAALAQTIRKLTEFLATTDLSVSEVVIADNGSTDQTLKIARRLEAEHHIVRVLRIEEKGRGGALRTAWGSSNADILSYMDVDLSTELAAYPSLVGALATGDFDLATGSRLLTQSQTTRSWKRELISQIYNRLLQIFFRVRFSDAQCGFKAITRRAFVELSPIVEDNAWFFDTELLVWAERLKYRLFDQPVTWVEGSDSRVKIWSTAVADIKGLIRLRRNLANRAGDILRQPGRILS